MADPTAGWTFTKKTVEQYQFNGPHGMWAIITLDPRGIFQAVSDVGDYAYDGWGHHGRESFKHFLLQLTDPDYFIGKVKRGDREFDFEATLRAVRKRILDKRRAGACVGSLDKAEARAAWDEADELEETRDATFFVHLVMTECPALYGHVFESDGYEVSSVCRDRWPAWSLRFFHEIFRGQFAPALRAELGIDAPAQEAAVA